MGVDVPNSPFTKSVRGKTNVENITQRLHTQKQLSNITLNTDKHGKFAQRAQYAITIKRVQSLFISVSQPYYSLIRN
jgi:hypothetical protein